jgi:hypothetical protein
MFGKALGFVAAHQLRRLPAGADHDRVTPKPVSRCEHRGEHRRRCGRNLTTARATEVAYGRHVRIVSMLPSATEIVYALGLDDDLVGVTFECNHPPRARLEKTDRRGRPRYIRDDAR